MFFLSISAFGGPEMHIALFLKKLVHEKRYITESDLMELNSLCQIIPGPGSTQTLTAIAHKIGGPRLAFLSLLIWILPASLLMTFFAIATPLFEQKIFRFIAPMAIGFIVMAAIKMTRTLKKDRLPIILALGSALFTLVFHSPFIFPILLIAGAAVQVNLGNKNFIPNNKPLVNIRWANLSLMLLILVTVALLGQFTRANFPEISKPARLFENLYRMGSMVFGGGNVLYSMILTEFVEFKNYLRLEEYQTGLGLLQAVPGPTFTIATFASGLAMRNFGYGIHGQIIGCTLGTVAIFLPGTLLIFFLYPIWNQVKTYPIVYRSLDGIIAVSIGFLWSAALFMFSRFFFTQSSFDLNQVISLGIFALTVLYLQYTQLPAILLVIVTIMVGYVL